MSERINIPTKPAGDFNAISIDVASCSLQHGMNAGVRACPDQLQSASAAIAALSAAELMSRCSGEVSAVNISLPKAFSCRG